MASPSPSASERAPGTIVFRATVAQGPSAGGGGADAPQAPPRPARQTGREIPARSGVPAFRSAPDQQRHPVRARHDAVSVARRHAHRIHALLALPVTHQHAPRPLPDAIPDAAVEPVRRRDLHRLGRQVLQQAPVHGRSGGGGEVRPHRGAPPGAFSGTRRSAAVPKTPSGPADWRTGTPPPKVTWSGRPQASTASRAPTGGTPSLSQRPDKSRAFSATSCLVRA